MKHMNRILALALALMMVLGLATTAYADGTGYTVTIKNATGHTYKIYQIFTGDLTTKNGEEILSNVKYGTDYTPDDTEVGDLVPETALKNLDTATISPDGNGTEMTVSADTATAEGLVAGYYMIKDTTDSLPSGDTPSAVIFQVVGDTELYSKHTGTTIVKKVMDTNDTTGVTTNWQDSADYDINDVVPFQSTATFDGLAHYKTYKVVFTDTMAKGLTYVENSMKVSVDGVDKTDSFTIDVADCSDTEGDYAGGKVITVTCNDITTLTEANAATIVLDYSATLNANANIGAAGNPNKIKVSTKADGTGETPADVNVVFTYKVNVDKVTGVGENKTPLTGAGFTLYKEVPAGTAGAQTGAQIKAAFTQQNVKADALVNEKNYITIAATVAESGSTFGFNGVDDGTYVLVETTIPAGYNAWDAKQFEIAATHNEDAEAPALLTLTGGNLLTGLVDDQQVLTGVLDADIVNNAGATLPETGGIGTTLFYAIGGLLVVAAVVLLVTKKRMNAAE